MWGTEGGGGGGRGCHTDFDCYTVITFLLLVIIKD